MTNWVLTTSPGARVVAAHRDGVPWFAAPLPRRWHWCRAQTSGWIEFRQVERCACGAIRDVYRGRWSSWVWKNTRRGKPQDPTVL